MRNLGRGNDKDDNDIYSFRDEYNVGHSGKNYTLAITCEMLGSCTKESESLNLKLADLSRDIRLGRVRWRGVKPQTLIINPKPET